MNVYQIRNYFISKIGSKVIIIYNGSRNKKCKFAGILYKVFNNVFLIKLNNNSIKCFNIIDILTKKIQIYI